MEQSGYHKTLLEIWNTLKHLYGEAEITQEEIKIENQHRRSWSVDVDTRLKSQVIDNKPFHPVRKIIK